MRGGRAGRRDDGAMGDQALKNWDTIDGAGLPAGFLVADGSANLMRSAERAGREVFRVEARTMANGHQKEAVITEGPAGRVWRLVSDEGPNLKGTDLAPFPLGFFNAGLHADYMGRLRRLARHREVPMRVASLEVLNQYYFSGSFFKGTGQGEAEAPVIRLAVESSASPDTVAAVLRDSLLASPAHAAVAVPLKNTFALYVNGRRCPVTRVAASSGPNITDPFVAHPRAPVPANPSAEATIIERLPYQPSADGAPRVIPGEGRIPILIRGTSEVDREDGVVATTVYPTSPGSRFRIRCDERTDDVVGPSGLACVAAGIAFCFLTQFTRYIEYRHHKVRAIRLVQETPFTLSSNGADFLAGGIEPVDTHVFLNAEDPDEVMQNLLEVAENTCYLHAALRGAAPSRIEAVLNGQPLAPAPAAASVHLAS